MGNGIPEIIADEEFLYRGITALHWCSEESRITSAAFKNPIGVSVDRSHGREEKVCASRLLNNDSRFLFIARILTKDVRDGGMYPIYKPLEENIYHSEIHRSETEIALTGGQINKLKQSAEIVLSREEFEKENSEL